LSTPIESRDVRNCRVFSRAASASAVSIGFLALLGWMFDIPVLTSVIPGLPTMRPNAALCFALAGAALWLMQLRPGELSSPRVRRMRAARVLSGLVVLMGFLTLGEYLFHWNPGIDEFFFHRALLATGVLHPGRMAGATSLGFVFLGASLLFIRPTRPQLFQILALLATLDGCVASLGYLLDIRELYDISTYGSMAMQTCLLFVAMGMAVLAARPRIGLMAEVTSEYVGGMMARTVLPLMVMVPIFFGWLRWKGQTAGLYGTEFGIALRTMGEVATCGVLLWISTVWLNRIDHDRRQTERQKLRLAAIVESSDDAIFSKDLSGTILSWNQGAERLYGYSANEIIGKPVATLIPLDLRQEAAEFLDEIAHGQLVTRAETVRQRKDGSLVSVSLVISPVRDFDGKVVGASASAHDISERKRAEEALRTNEEHLRLALDAARMGTFDWDMLQNLITWSPSHEELWGYRPGEFGGTYEEFSQRVHPEDLPGIHSEVTRCSTAREPFSREFRVVWPDSSVHRIFSRGEFSFDNAGQPARMRGVAMDISDRKHAEEALRESEARLNEAQHNAHIGSWHYIPGGTFIWSDEMYELFKLPRDVPVTFEAIVSVIHPEDRDGRYNRAFERALASAAVDYRSEYRVVWPDGQVRWMYSLGKIQRDANGGVIEAVGTVQDVTEREHAEEALRQSSENLRALSAYLLTIREEERKQMAREVHDDLGQKLTALRFDISALAKRLEKKPGGLGDKVIAAREMVDASILTVRQLAARLRPSVLDDLGLPAALTWEA